MALKLNVLHWHISDSQSFPSGSALYPKLNEAGAYLFPEASYGVGDLAGVVAYARARGVRVMPEWDMPGHGSWGMGYPELMISDGPCDDTLDPTRQVRPRGGHPALLLWHAFAACLGGLGCQVKK